MCEGAIVGCTEEINKIKHNKMNSCVKARQESLTGRTFNFFKNLFSHLAIV